MTDHSRWIVKPFLLFDCCLENDRAPAMILVLAEQARVHPHKPLYKLSAMSGSHYRAGTSVHNTPDCATSTFESTVPRLYDMDKLGPDDVDVAQIYENFTGGVLSSKHCQYVSTTKMERDARDSDFRSHSRVCGCLYLRRVSQVHARAKRVLSQKFILYGRNTPGQEVRFQHLLKEIQGVQNSGVPNGLEF